MPKTETSAASVRGVRQAASGHQRRRQEPVPIRQTSRPSDPPADRQV